LQDITHFYISNRIAGVFWKYAFTARVLLVLAGAFVFNALFNFPLIFVFFISGARVASAAPGDEMSENSESSLCASFGDVATVVGTAAAMGLYSFRGWRRPRRQSVWQPF
jgi:hypothetical protein